MSATIGAGEIRLLVLAAQRHGSRMLAGYLREASVTPTQAEALQVLGGHAPLTLPGVCGPSQSSCSLQLRPSVSGSVRVGCVHAAARPAAATAIHRSIISLPG